MKKVILFATTFAFAIGLGWFGQQNRDAQAGPKPPSKKLYQTKHPIGDPNKPDLIVSFQDIDPDPPALGAKANLKVKIKNQGGTAAGATKVKFTMYKYVNSQWVEDPSLTAGDRDVPPLNPTETSDQIKWSWWSPPELLQYQFSACADAIGQVVEGIETNNCKQLIFTVLPTALPPDLIVESIGISPTNPAPGEGISFVATIRNVGEGSIGPSYTSFWVDRGSDGSEDAFYGGAQVAVGPSTEERSGYTPFLMPYQSAEVTWPDYRTFEEGNNTILVCSDAKVELNSIVSKYDESSETNNCLSRQFTVD